jgi:hypothetical protein
VADVKVSKEVKPTTERVENISQTISLHSNNEHTTHVVTAVSIHAIR